MPPVHNNPTFYKPIPSNSVHSHLQPLPPISSSEMSHSTLEQTSRSDNACDSNYYKAKAPTASNISPNNNGTVHDNGSSSVRDIATTPNQHTIVTQIRQDNSNSGLSIPRDTHSSLSNSPPVTGQTKSAPNFKKKWIATYSVDKVDKVEPLPTTEPTSACPPIIKEKQNVNSANISGSVPDKLSPIVASPIKQEEIGVVTPVKQEENTSSPDANNMVIKTEKKPASNTEIMDNGDQTTDTETDSTMRDLDTSQMSKVKKEKKDKKEGTKKRPPSALKDKKEKAVKKVKELKIKKKEAKTEPKLDHDTDDASDCDDSSKGSKGKQLKLVVKRGRKPKGQKLKENKKVDEKKKKLKLKLKKEKKMNKPNIDTYKASREPFLQMKVCSSIAPKLTKCIECQEECDRNGKKDKNESRFCRFFEFRKLKFGKSGVVYDSGFSEPNDAKDSDLDLWLPPPGGCIDLQPKTAQFMLELIGGPFCTLFNQEQQAMDMHLGEANKTAWKKPVRGVREMCDVCDTTLFNIHWVCKQCGFVVCIDCYKYRKEKDQRKKRTGDNEADLDQSDDDDDDDQENEDEDNLDKDKGGWLMCKGGKEGKDTPHSQEKLIMAQIIAKEALSDVHQLLHEIDKVQNFSLKSDCNPIALPPITNDDQKVINASPEKAKNGDSAHLLNDAVSSSNLKENKGSKNGQIETTNGSNIESGSSSVAASSPLSLLADVALGDKSNTSFSTTTTPLRDADDSLAANNNSASQLRVLLVSGKPKGAKKDKHKPIANSTKNSGHSNELESDKLKKGEAFRYFRPTIAPILQVSSKPSKVWTFEESSKLYPQVDHSWLCDGRLLVLPDSTNEKGNLKLFQDQWARNQVSFLHLSH